MDFLQSGAPGKSETADMRDTIRNIYLLKLRMLSKRKIFNACRSLWNVINTLCSAFSGLFCTAG